MLTDNPLPEEREPDVLEHQQQSAASTPSEPVSSGNSAVERAAPAGDPFIRCGATVKSTGHRCSNGAGPSGYCVVHDRTPDGLARMQQARSLGGRAPRVRLGITVTVAEGFDLGSSEGQVDVLNAALRALAVGSISSTTAGAISQLVKAANQVLVTDQGEAIKELAAKLDELIVDAPRSRR